MKIFKKLEKNKTIKTIESIVLTVLLLTSIVSFIYGYININKKVKCEDLRYVARITLIRDIDVEEYDDDSLYCDVIYQKDNKKMIVTYSYEDYLNLKEDYLCAYEYVDKEGNSYCFINEEIDDQIYQKEYKDKMSIEMNSIFNLAISSLILSLSFAVILFFRTSFTTYEKIWFISIMFLASIISILFPEESANGVNGIVIMLLYLLDTFLNILCELLISKQSRYNFIVSVAVEICEILICVVLMYRFATLASTLFFWLPIDIISFVNWSNHKDEDKDDITIVRKLKGYQEILIIIVIIVWTILVGYILSGLDIKTDFIENKSIAVLISYLDACASAVGIANGLFIFFRLQEQWIAWYLCALLESIMNILSGQYVLLVLKLGYFTNTTYGYIKWNKYIKKRNETLLL